MRASITAFVCAAALLVALAATVSAQDQGPTTNSSGTVAKKKPATDPGAAAGDGSTLPKIPSVYTKKDKVDVGTLQTFKADVDTVSVDVAVMDKNGRFIPNIPKGYFRVLEDNVPQQVTSFNSHSEAPMTVAILVEFDDKFVKFYGINWFETLNLAYGFVSTLKPEDYVAVIAYDMKTEILSDFTTNRMETQEALHRLTIPAWQEANLFDAVADTADRMSGIEGRKAILLLSNGIDTFSKLTYDKTRKVLQEAGVPIYAIGTMQMQRLMMGAAGDNISFLQADNQLRTFANETGGRAFFPRFYGEFGNIFGQIQQSLREQYVLTYSPSNKAHDGTYRKIKVQLVDHDGNPIALRDEKNKPLKYSIVAKTGYKAPRAVE
ncbi:MAG TPA: VWA domain-containing protein [Bryobacteraceae bacterium]|jgi:VWFA-related protein|nr:VWA domain-containing protein [Bryobacteraceae bacterium]